MTFNIYTSIELIPLEDWEKLKIIDRDKLNQFFYDPFTFNICIIYEGNEILGFGLIRVVNEFKMCLKEDLNNITKAKILKELMYKALELSQCKEVIVEITKGGQHYIDSLIKHYNFYETEGKVLRLEK